MTSQKIAIGFHDSMKEVSTEKKELRCEEPIMADHRSHRSRLIEREFRSLRLPVFNSLAF